MAGGKISTEEAPLGPSLAPVKGAVKLRVFPSISVNTPVPANAALAAAVGLFSLRFTLEAAASGAMKLI